MARLPAQVQEGGELPHGGLEAADADGRTPLALAAQRGSVDIVGQLLAAGANREAVTRTGNTPLLLAASAGRARRRHLQPPPRYLQSADGGLQEAVGGDGVHGAPALLRAEQGRVDPGEKPGGA